jgi:hypothetical protein
MEYLNYGRVAIWAFLKLFARIEMFWPFFNIDNNEILNFNLAILTSFLKEHMPNLAFLIFWTWQP